MSSSTVIDLTAWAIPFILAWKTPNCKHGVLFSCFKHGLHPPGPPQPCSKHCHSFAAKLSRHDFACDPKAASWSWKMFVEKSRKNFAYHAQTMLISLRYHSNGTLHTAKHCPKSGGLWNIHGMEVVWPKNPALTLYGRFTSQWFNPEPQTHCSKIWYRP